jgi:hypothetical protein
MVKLEKMRLGEEKKDIHCVHIYRRSHGPRLSGIKRAGKIKTNGKECGGKREGVENVSEGSKQCLGS